MKFKIILLALFCMICLLSSGASVLGYTDTLGTSDDKDLSYTLLLKLDRSISELYTEGNDSHKQAAYKTLQNIKNQLNNIELLQYGTVTAWKQMKQDVLTIEQGIINNEPNVVWRGPISSLLLASDALLQAEHGPWLQYESVLLDDLQSIRRSSASTISNDKKTNAVIAQLTIFKQRVDRMQTAAYMVGDEMRMTELLQRTDQLSGFFRDTSQVTWTSQQFKEIESAIHNIEETIHTLFAQAEETITVPVVSASSGWNPTTLALLIGALISGLLTFTAYRKYKQAPYGVKKV